jgi:hypothetical protein
VPRDILLSWRETNQSLLALRTLPSPDAPNQRLLTTTWSAWGKLANEERIAAELDGALARLSRVLGMGASA